MIWVKNDVNQFGFYFLILSFYLYSTRGLRDIFNMKKHPFYLLGINPWPLLISVLILRLILSLVWWFKSNSIIFILYNILLILVIMFIWFRDNIRDSVINGGHLIEVVTGIKYGIVIFIVSEVFFFIGFFLTFINNRFHPDYNIGDYWPPFRFQIINPFEVPLLNTLILLSSGITITASHYFLLNNKYYLISFYLCLTIMLGLYFTRIQILEYVLISFSIWENTLGSTFFIATGFHGFHVIIGSLFLLITLIRGIKLSYTFEHHFGVEAAIWYWHFVDVIWVFLFRLIYWWGF